MAAPDRLELLAAQTTLTGLDFVAVSPSQTELDVFFLRDPDALAPPLTGLLAAESVTVLPEGDEKPMPILGLSWPSVQGRRVLRISLPFPGGFQRHRLTVDHARVDPWFSALDFSFKADCPSTLDCRPREPCCPDDEMPSVDVNPLARDYAGLRSALFDHAARHWPDWQDRLAPDVGVMLLEMAAALGDEFAYIQDQINHELRFEGARTLRSLRQHARLVDYERADSLSATGWLSVEAKSGAGGLIPAGTGFEARSDNGEVIAFEAGFSLEDRLANRSYAVASAANRFLPYLWDETAPPASPGEVGPLWRGGTFNPADCLPAGSTELWLDGHHAANLPLTDVPLDPAGALGRHVLLRTDPSDPAQTARRFVVRVIAVSESTDALNGGHPVTQLRWETAQALPFALDLTALSVEGNLVPVSQGRTSSVIFSCGAPASGPKDRRRSVERKGPGGLTRHLFSLPESQKTPLTRLAGAAQAAPELALFALRWQPASKSWQRAERWDYRQSLLGAQASLPDSRHFTLDDGFWEPVVKHWRNPAVYAGRSDPGGPPLFEGGRLVHYDLAPQAGSTLRFGTGEFGLAPAEGSWFECLYRLGAGRSGNVVEGAITYWADAPLSFVASFANPVPTTGGEEPESAESVRRLAPNVFRSLTYRAVIEADYTEAAERLDWVSAASSRFRFTGSWLALFATADPAGLTGLGAERRLSLAEHLDLFRQTARQVHVTEPRYVSVDLDITVCVARGHARKAVREGVEEALFGRCHITGFFSPDNFTFGTPLMRSRLEAAIQRVEGVHAVEGIRIRRRGHFDWRALEASYEPAASDELLRIANDLAHPEWGNVLLTLEGGS
jgi:hypothetical protein